MIVRLLATASLAVFALASTLTAAELPKSGSLAFILDCSRSMSQDVTNPAPVQPDGEAEIATRMDLAQLTLRKMLRDVAADGTCEVGLWLYGHRIVWEPEVKQPELMTQDQYLEATVGYDALRELLPGDDVEQAQPLKRFNIIEFERAKARLDVVKPWGEKPLYLSILRAMEALADRQPTGPRAIVVFTDGGNEQWLAKHKTDQLRIAGLLDKNLIPIHFLHFGPTPTTADESEQELISLAEQGGGSLAHVGTKTEITLAQVLSTVRKEAPPAVEEVLTAGTAEGATSDDIAAKIAEAKAILAAKPAHRTITGSVVYYNRPVQSATITLEGMSIPAVKTDRQGQFILKKVPAGRTYRVLVKAIAKNSFREKNVDLEVEANDEEQPFLTIDVGKP